MNFCAALQIAMRVDQTVAIGISVENRLRIQMPFSTLFESIKG
jgi:hypothetical protein